MSEKRMRFVDVIVCVAYPGNDFGTWGTTMVEVPFDMPIEEAKRKALEIVEYNNVLDEDVVHVAVRDVWDDNEMDDWDDEFCDEEE